MYGQASHSKGTCPPLGELSTRLLTQLAKTANSQPDSVTCKKIAIWLSLPAVQPMSGQLAQVLLLWLAWLCHLLACMFSCAHTILARYQPNILEILINMVLIVFSCSAMTAKLHIKLLSMFALTHLTVCLQQFHVCVAGLLQLCSASSSQSPRLTTRVQVNVLPSTANTACYRLRREPRCHHRAPFTSTVMAQLKHPMQ